MTTSSVKMMMMMVMVVTVVSVAEARLVFPSGSDMGYIVPDDPEPEKYVDNIKWINELESEDGRPGLLERGIRAAVDQAKETLSALMDGRLKHKDNSLNLQREDTVKSDPIENWKGRWFPHAPKDAASAPEAEPDTRKKNEDLPDYLKDKDHGVVMGVPSVVCDNGKVNLTVDWDSSPVNYTCFDPKTHRLPVNENLDGVEKCVHVSHSYMSEHICMQYNITYNTTLPTFGPHRPIWPVYGEYRFLPVQRWLHGIEHGALVMLYHPCAEPVAVDRLRKLVTGCFRKHIISPYTLLTKERPMALLGWGCTLEMSKVIDNEVKDFIVRRALHGPEGHFPKDGGFSEELIKNAEYPPGSDGKDIVVCSQT